MDKKKIIFIVDDGLPSGGLFDALKAMGEQLHMDIEMMELKDTLRGTKPDMAILDDGPLPVPERMLDIDFSQLETRLSGRYDTVIVGAGRGSPAVTVTGRRPSEPEFQSILGLHGRNMPSRRYGKSILQQDIYAMIAEATGKNRELIKELNFPHAYGTGKFFDELQQIPRKPEKSRYFASPYGVNNNGADHPSRKREPKGPRGQWGKLK